MRRCLPGWIGSPASMDLRHAADRHTGAAGTAKEKVYKLRDECGLLLMVRPTGAKWWRLRYRFQGPGKMISLGSCPDVTLSMRGTAATVYEIGCTRHLQCCRCYKADAHRTCASCVPTNRRRSPRVVATRLRGSPAREKPGACKSTGIETARYAM